MSFFSSVADFFSVIIDFLQSIVENTILFLKILREVVTYPSLFSGLVFQPLAVCIVVVVAVAVVKNILGRV